MRPQVDEYAPFYGTYVEKIKEEDPLRALEHSLQEAKEFLAELPAEKADYRYAEGKWTLKEVLQHTIDTERIMAYRSLAIARHDKTPLPGYDENAYVAALNMEQRQIPEMIEEFLLLKQSTIILFRSFSPDAYLQRGNMSGREVTLRALAYIIAGHQRHHFQVLKERYF